MEENYNTEFRILNENIKVWNGYIDRTEKSIKLTADLIRTIPNQVNTRDDAIHVNDVVKKNAFSMINKMPVLNYSMSRKKLPLLHFETNEIEIYDILDGKFKIKLTSNGWFPSSLSCIKFAENNTILSVAGNSFFFSINYEIRAEVSSWFAVARSAENMVLDFDTSQDRAALAMEDNFIRIINYKTRSVMSEFPAVVMNPTFVKLAPNDFVVVANDAGEICYQKIDNIEGNYDKNIPEPVVFKITEKPVECKFRDNGKIIILTGTNAYELDVSDSRSISKIQNDEPIAQPSLMVEPCEEGFRVFNSEGQSSVIPLSGVEISTIAVSKSPYPKIAVGTNEGCVYIWETFPISAQK